MTVLGLDNFQMPLRRYVEADDIAGAADLRRVEYRYVGVGMGLIEVAQYQSRGDFRAWQIRFITSKVAMVYAVMEITHPWKNGHTGQVLASLVCAMIYDDWRIASAHHSDMA